MTCTLANHKNLVQTPAVDIVFDRTTCIANIASEFELVADERLEFNLSFKILRDAHLLPQRPVQEPVPVVSTKSKHSHSHSASGFKAGLRNLLSSPKKSRPDRIENRPPSRQDLNGHVPAQSAPRAPEVPPILAYMNREDDIATFSLKAADVIPHCTGNKLVKLYTCQPALGAERGLRDVAMVELHLFYIPPMPEVPIKDLPQSIDEGLAGLREAENHEKTHFEGVLTQQGADCTVSYLPLCSL